MEITMPSLHSEKPEHSLVDVDGCSKRMSAYGLTVQENTKDSTKLFNTKLNNMDSDLLSREWGELRDIPKALEDRHWCLVSINFCQDTPILGKFSKSESSNYMIQCIHAIIYLIATKGLVCL
jgi:hypothetical protein